MYIIYKTYPPPSSPYSYSTFNYDGKRYANLFSLCRGDFLPDEYDNGMNLHTIVIKVDNRGKRSGSILMSQFYFFHVICVIFNQ
jgi:hypothetical protein